MPLTGGWGFVVVRPPTQQKAMCSREQPSATLGAVGKRPDGGAIDGEDRTRRSKLGSWLLMAGDGDRVACEKPPEAVMLSGHRSHRLVQSARGQ